MRTRDLQKVERKNIKYRENNRILTDAVQSLENRNISSAAGSGSNQNDIYVSYQDAIRETNEDIIENRLDEGDEQNQPIVWQQVDGVDGSHGGPSTQDNTAQLQNQMAES